MTSKNLKLVSHKLVNANDTSIIVTREYLISLLRAWQQDKITTAQFYKTIEILHSSDTEFLDWENNGELVTSEHIPSESVTSEVIAHLEMLDLDFIIQEDIEPIIEFLNTPIGKIEEGMRKWQQYKPKTSHEERIKKFNGRYPYIKVE
ncbi:MAG TPA: hypothetical protein LFV91_02620 [Rickettsia endosymbiont of Bembidion nr. Transversale]|nr:hypothetical protein [Rickettsia endosymbiont of Bembidion nr. Transversale]